MDIQEFLSQVRFAKLLGIKLTEIRPGEAKAKLHIRDEHMNAVNILQGGVLFTLADYTVAAAANAYGNIAVVINSNISFIKSVKTGEIFAWATETSSNSKIASYTVSITDSSGEQIASCQSIVFRKKELIGSV